MPVQLLVHVSASFDPLSACSCGGGTANHDHALACNRAKAYLLAHPQRCGCGFARSPDDPRVIAVHSVQGVPSRMVRRRGDVVSDARPPTLRACLGCGAIYVAAIAHVPENL
ncbi:MAG TPA: hypothetical protein VNM39_13220 [Verrucomicrobiae bacterium]|nr:hypothetical protein [Verrucomicrobiae bacterium]